MKLFIYILIGLSSVAAFPFAATAQSEQSNPAVLAVIGDISTADARERIVRSVKKKPNSKSCKAGEWEKLGFRHAYEYAPGEDDYDARWAMVQQRCAKHKITVDEARYTAGFREGSLLYCGYESGIVFGYYFKKDSAAPICENLKTPTHDRGYEAGKIIAAINKDRRELEKAYEDVKAEYDIFLDRIDGQPSTVAEQELYEEANSITQELKTELDFHQKRYDALNKTYQIKNIYHRCAALGQCAPDMDIAYEIPPMPQRIP